MKKKLCMMMVWMSLVTGVHSQGVSKLFGLVGGTPQSNQSSNGFLFSTDSSGNNFQELYSFPVTTFGANPANLEMVAFGGKLYGTTQRGGESNYGTIFEYNPVTNTYIKKFDFGPNVSVTGGSPKGSLLLYNNKFYGMASEYSAAGGGCIFEWDPVTNIYTKRYDFNGPEGAAPQNSLRLLNGKMYGTTAQGGASNLGAVFEWDPVTNICTKLYELTGPNGWGFYNNVTIYNNKIYGMSHQAGANNYGALYVIDPSLPLGSNTTIIKHFDAASGGIANNNEMIVHNNKLYGCLHQGGANSQGTLFELDPVTNIFIKLVDFNYSINGANPLGKLVLNGTKFLGLCSSGGANGSGTIYEWDPAAPTVIVKKYDFLINNYNNPGAPASTLAYFNSKFYAVNFERGFVNQGTLFEYDYTANTVTKKLTFNAAENGRIPFGKPVLLEGKLYGICQQGPQEIFGTPYGCLWSYNPSTAVYSRQFLFDNPNAAANGRNPVSSPVPYNGKLYGVTNNGGVSDVGVLYEFDPATSVYNKSSMQPIGGAFPIGTPTVYNNKLYGMTAANGAGNNGIIYSCDIASGILAKVYDVQNAGSITPNGGFTVYNNLLYGTTAGGGVNNIGGIIAFNPAINSASTIASFSGAMGFNVANAPTLYNNKLYMTALSGGAQGRGSILQLDLATNILTNVHSFSTALGGTGLDPKGELTVSGDKLYCITQEGTTLVKVVEFDPLTNTAVAKSSHTVANLNIPVAHNSLTVVPAFIANGLAGSCENYPTIVIDATNNNKWVPILNTAGDVVAEIKANGNNLGNVTTSVYINNGAVREDVSKRLFMDRNISITTQNPVNSGTVNIRLYIKASEFLALKNATNSEGEPSGINSVNDIAVYKNDQSCTGTLTTDAVKQTTTAELYEYGYVLSASVSSFSTFFFAKNTFSVLPVRLLSFAGSVCADDICLLWTVENEQNFSHYVVEKSIDGIGFSQLVTVTARNTGAKNNYTTTDIYPANGDNYYRLKMIDRDGTFTYSRIIKVNMGELVRVSLQPNPASDFVIVKGVKGYQFIRIVDMTGRVMIQKAVQNNMEELTLSHLNKGMYLVQLIKESETISLQLIRH